MGCKPSHTVPRSSLGNNISMTFARPASDFMVPSTLGLKFSWPVKSGNIAVFPWSKLVHHTEIFSWKAESLSMEVNTFSNGSCKPELTRLRC